MFHSVNEEQGLYVLDCGGGYSCLGFDVALERGAGMHKWLTDNGVTIPPMNPSLRGTAEGYADYLRITEAGAEYNRLTGKRCEAELCPQLIGLENKRVEVTDEHGNKRRFYVGKSTGWVPIHLEIKTRRSTGGGAVYGFPFKSVKVVGQR